MFVLVDYNKNYSDVCSELKLRGYTPVTVFKLNLNGKLGIIEQNEKIKELRSRIKPKYSAVQVQIDKLENNSIGVVNSLRNDFDLVIGLGGLNKINRFFVEDTLIDFLRDPQNVIFRSKMDFIHHFNSGLNHILCNMAKERDIGFIFSLNFVSGVSKNIAKEFGRITQNVSFARKYDVPIYLNFVIGHLNSIKSPNELSKIGSLVDMSSKQCSEISTIIEKVIKKNEFRRSDKYVCEGIHFE